MAKKKPRTYKRGELVSFAIGKRSIFVAEVIKVSETGITVQGAGRIWFEDHEWIGPAPPRTLVTRDHAAINGLADEGLSLVPKPKRR